MPQSVKSFSPVDRRFIWIPVVHKPRSWWDKATTDAWEWVKETVDDTFGGWSAQRSKELELDELLRPVRASLAELVSCAVNSLKKSCE
jgi:hypothetical protein